jgi:hypothetical protein
MRQVHVMVEVSDAPYCSDPVIARSDSIAGERNGSRRRILVGRIQVLLVVQG